MIDNVSVHHSYEVLIDILLNAEGSALVVDNNLLNYNQKNLIHIPTELVPLLYAASNSVQMAVAFLPYYLKHHSLDNNPCFPNLKEKTIENNAWFKQEIYLEILKFLLSDTIRTMPITHSPTIKHAYENLSKSVFLYDGQVTKYAPYYGMNIHELDSYDCNKTYYLVGDIYTEALEKLQKIMVSQIIYGIAPNQYIYNWQENIHQRLNFFSQTVLAGSLNMQLPFIENYFQAGISPFSFYHLLYRSKCPNAVIQNAVCLLQAKEPTIKLSDYIQYEKIFPHTDLHLLEFQNHPEVQTINYLTTLSLP